MGYSQAVRHQTLTLASRWFESIYPSQKIRELCSRIFLSKPQAWHIIDARSAAYIIKGASALVSHHAPACIYLRLDDTQCFALMICNSYGIDDIHAFGTICGTLNFTLRPRRNTSLGRKPKLHCGLPQLNAYLFYQYSKGETIMFVYFLRFYLHLRTVYAFLRNKRGS